jgi:hypothetical protein
MTLTCFFLSASSISYAETILNCRVSGKQTITGRGISTQELATKSVTVVIEDKGSSYLSINVSGSKDYEFSVITTETPITANSKEKTYNRSDSNFYSLTYSNGEQTDYRERGEIKISRVTGQIDYSIRGTLYENGKIRTIGISEFSGDCQKIESKTKF